MKLVLSALGGLMIAGAAAADPGSAAGTLVVSSSGGGADLRVPPGYTRVWDDDRLNPHRARGTSAGEAAMNRIWTEQVPRVLRTGPAAPAAAADGRDAVVVRRVPGVYVQVAAFGDRLSARTAANRLRRDGIPAQPATLRRGEGATPIVLAGPYPNRAAARSGLAELRGAGYRQAFVRN